LRLHLSRRRGGAHLEHRHLLLVLQQESAAIRKVVAAADHQLTADVQDHRHVDQDAAAQQPVAAGEHFLAQRLKTHVVAAREKLKKLVNFVFIFG